MNASEQQRPSSFEKQPFEKNTSNQDDTSFANSRYLPSVANDAAFTDLMFRVTDTSTFKADGDATVEKVKNQTTSGKVASMSEITREEIAARLEAVEARMDARLARIEGLVSDIAKGQVEVSASNKATRNTIIGTGIAVVLGIAAFNATVLSNMVASFESGKNTASSQAAAEKAISEATKALEAATEQVRRDLTKAAKPAK